MTSKRWMTIAAIVIVAGGVGYAAMRGWFAPTSEMAGTIGAAKRYQTDQVASGDVVLRDPRVQTFLQSDFFHKLATNPRFRKLVLDSRFQELAKKRAFWEIAGDGTLAELLANPHWKLVLDQDGYSELLKKSKEFRDLTEQDMAKHVLRDRDFLELVDNEAFLELLRKDKFRMLLSDAEQEKVHSVEAFKRVKGYQSVAALAEWSEMERRPKFLTLLATEDVQRAVQEKELVDLLESKAVIKLLRDDNWGEIMANADLLEAATSDELAEAFEGLEAMLQDDSAAELLSVFSDPTVVEACKRVELREIGEAEMLARAVEKEK